MDPKYPIYIVSKGRWETRLTSKALDRMCIPYSIVVEPQERDRYAAMIDPRKIIVLPFSNLGQGSIPARNWIWDHAVGEGAARHWILDDNIRGFYRLNRNFKVPVASGAIFRAAEDFCDRYENVAKAGFNYAMFVWHRTKRPPFILNTRIYSCILLKTDLPHRWRGKYNEDTDLSLRLLKDGWCTILFNMFLAAKVRTMTMRGGNTDELYRQDGETDGRLLMAQSIIRQHPDVASLKWRWGRWQHHVDYRRFKRNRLKLKPGVIVPKGVNDYGMVLKRQHP